MLIEITRSGVYRSAGDMIPVGTQIEVPDDFTGWANKYRVVNQAAGKSFQVATPKRTRKKREPKTEAQPEQSSFDTDTEADANGGDDD